MENPRILIQLLAPPLTTPTPGINTINKSMIENINIIVTYFLRIVMSSFIR